MKRLTCAVFSAALSLFAADARAVTIDTVPVGNSGNTAGCSECAPGSRRRWRH